MEARATAKGVRIAPQKARLVIDLIRGKSVIEAYNILKNVTQKAGLPIYKVLDSAVSNAENNLGLKREDLVIKECVVDEGRTLKRVHMASKSNIDKRYHRHSHIKIVVWNKES